MVRHIRSLSRWTWVNKSFNLSATVALYVSKWSGLQGSFFGPFFGPQWSPKWSPPGLFAFRGIWAGALWRQASRPGWAWPDDVGWCWCLRSSWYFLELVSLVWSSNVLNSSDSQTYQTRICFHFLCFDVLWYRTSETGNVLRNYDPDNTAIMKLCCSLGELALFMDNDRDRHLYLSHGTSLSWWHHGEQRPPTYPIALSDHTWPSKLFEGNFMKFQCGTKCTSCMVPNSLTSGGPSNGAPVIRLSTSQYVLLHFFWINAPGAKSRLHAISKLLRNAQHFKQHQKTIGTLVKRGIPWYVQVCPVIVREAWGLS